MEENRQKILIVDDMLLNIKMLSAMLSDDYAIVVATNGEKALEIAATESAPDIILLDIIMPDMDGYEVLRRLKADARTQNIPVIFISAKGGEADQMRGLELGAVDYVSKPFSMPIVSARIKTHLTLRNAVRMAQTKHEQLHAVISHAMDGIIHINTQGMIQSFNPAAEKMFGYAEAEAIGQNINMLMPEPDHSQHDDYLKRYIATREKHLIGKEREVTALRKDGSTFDMALHVNVMRLKDENYFIGILRDISERKQAEEKIRTLAHFDALTGLPNRALFMDRMHQTLALAHRNKSGFSLFFLDLDGFKAVNDTLGHAAGDHVLSLVADRLRACVREVDTVARLGGDEFTLILSGIMQRERAAIVADKMISALNKPMIINGKEYQYHIGASIGITMYPADGEGVDMLIRCADEAMYEAKRAGKNRYIFYH